MKMYFYYKMGIRYGITMDKAVYKQLFARLEAKVAKEIHKTVSELAPIQAQLNELRNTTVNLSQDTDTEVSRITNKRNQENRQIILSSLSQRRDICLMHLKSAVLKQEKRYNALFESYALGASQCNHQQRKEESVQFKSQAYADFLKSIDMEVAVK